MPTKTATKTGRWEVSEAHLAAIPDWNRRWIDIITSTQAMSDMDRQITEQAIYGMYAAAKLKKPRVIFVSSPLQAAIVAGAAAAWWYEKEHGQIGVKAATGDATKAATWAATWDATGDATRDATKDATGAATWAATGDATGAATWAATGAATRAATGDATGDATGAATWDATGDATRDATWAATGDATKAATWAATWDATGDATRDATWDATGDATGAATWAATGDATGAATWAATGAATRAATRDATWAATRAATGDATGDATGAATWTATGAATGAAIKAATWAATWAATRDATGAATWAATRAATWAATGDATRAATWAATRAATWAATGAATWAATGAGAPDLARAMVDAACAVVGRSDFVLNCIRNATDMADGGNHWSDYVGFLSFVRDIVGWQHDSHEAYRHYELAAIHSSWRFMHPEFCIVSDRPSILKRTKEGRPHCDDGPSHAWRDGWKLWYIDGIQVDEQIVMRPETQTVQQIDSEQNGDVRSIRMRRFGWHRYVREINAQALDRTKNEISNTHEALFGFERDGKQQRVLVVTCPTARMFGLPVPPSIQTCEQAQAWLAGNHAKGRLVAAT